MLHVSLIILIFHSLLLAPIKRTEGWWSQDINNLFRCIPLLLNGIHIDRTPPSNPSYMWEIGWSWKHFMWFIFLFIHGSHLNFLVHFKVITIMKSIANATYVTCKKQQNQTDLNKSQWINCLNIILNCFYQRNLGQTLYWKTGSNLLGPNQTAEH